MPADPQTMSIANLAKYGHFDELRRRAAATKDLDLAHLFDRAVTDFRTVRRHAGHQQILQWCIDEGLDSMARAGWLNEPVVCLAAASGNHSIVEYMQGRGAPDSPFVRAAIGDFDYIESFAAENKLADLHDENGFNLLFYCAQSGLGRSNGQIKARLTEVCRLLLEHGVDPRHEVPFELPIFPALLCAYGGNEQIMRLLLQHGGLSPVRFHLTMEHALEPHQRSGPPYYHLAEVILESGCDINALRRDQGRTLLHASANRGAAQAVEWLLLHGANPNSLDDAGRTPLHVCAERNTSTAVAKLLIDVGADPFAKDAAGKTPLDYAHANKRAKVSKYLESLHNR